MRERSQSSLQSGFEDDEKAHPFSEHSRRTLGMLYRAHWSDLCRYLSVRFGSGPPEPEEVAQATFARYAAIAEADQIDNPKAYLFTIARHIVLDQHRRLQLRDNVHRDIVSTASVETLSDFSPERVLLGRERIAFFEQVIRRMPSLRRQVFLLARVEGLPYAEVGKRLGLREGAVQRHISRAIEDCMKAFEAAENDGGHR